MKEILFYPAIFEEFDGEYTVIFPDLDGCLTQGSGLEESYKMAFEVLGMTLTYLEEENREIPVPSNPKDIKLEGNQFVAIIEFKLQEYRKKYDSRAISKNCTIPRWMNVMALEKGLNFSQVLQEALMLKLDAPQKQNRI
jgi:Uncharacterized conserved protein